MEFVKHFTVNSMAQLASTYRNQGWSDAAEELEVQLKEMRKKKIGEGHLDTLIGMNNLAFTWEGQVRCAEAVSLESMLVSKAICDFARCGVISGW
jgi:lipopolysaccharide biosynthesis regulator YciM